MAHLYFVHGMYMTAASWAGWREWFEARGHTTDAVQWPGREGVPADLRAHPPEVLRTLTLDDVVTHVRERVAALDAPPVLIGHSMGGLVVQRLLAEGHGRAGVALSSAPANGLTVVSWSFLRANAPILLPSSAPIVMTLPAFRYGWAHTEDEATARALYETWVVPESRRVGKGPTTAAGRLDPAARAAPLLFVAGAEDRTCPAALNEKNAALYAGSPARTDFVTFPGRTHLICLQKGWEEVAERIASWIEEVGA